MSEGRGLWACTLPEKIPATRTVALRPSCRRRNVEPTDRPFCIAKSRWTSTLSPSPEIWRPCSRRYRPLWNSSDNEESVVPSTLTCMARSESNRGPCRGMTGRAPSTCAKVFVA